MNKPNESPSAETLGAYLKSVRAGLALSLRDVESATEGQVSNPYLSQLETGKITEPSPHILHVLAAVYQIPYEKLMERAGYTASSLMPAGAKMTAIGKKIDRRRKLANRSIDHLTAEEEKELLNYLSYWRTKNPRETEGR